MSFTLQPTGKLASDSQSRTEVCANVAAGFAWVMRAVETTPVALSLVADCSKNVTKYFYLSGFHHIHHELWCG
jgi:hypothetical protein